MLWEDEKRMKTLYVNGRVYTGELPLQTCFAVEDGAFSSVGETIPGADRRIDLQGIKVRAVCPGGEQVFSACR